MASTAVRCCLFLGGGSDVCLFFLLFIVFLIVCGDSVFVIPTLFFCGPSVRPSVRPVTLSPP